MNAVIRSSKYMQVYPPYSASFHMLAADTSD